MVNQMKNRPDRRQRSDRCVARRLRSFGELNESARKSGTVGESQCRRTENSARVPLLKAARNQFPRCSLLSLSFFLFRSPSLFPHNATPPQSNCTAPSLTFIRTGKLPLTDVCIVKPPLCFSSGRWVRIQKRTTDTYNISQLFPSWIIAGTFVMSQNCRYAPFILRHVHRWLTFNGKHHAAELEPSSSSTDFREK